MTAATVKSGSINSTAAISLTRRLLFPLNAGESLPPLLLSPSAAPDLNNELYDLIALALRAFVNPWWTKITRYDKEFLPDIARILTHVIRSLEARVLTATDIPNLLFRVIPTIVTQHYKDYRNAESKLSSSYATGGALSLPQLFHQLQPHMAVSANGTIEPEYYRQIVDHILKTSLPPEDYEPEAERLIIREIILKVLLQDVIPKVTQPWFIHMSILDLLGKTDGTPLLKPPDPPPRSTHTPAHSSLSFHTLLVFILSTIQSISGFGLALVQSYKHTLNTIKRVNAHPALAPQPLQPSETNDKQPPLTSATDSRLPPRPTFHPPIPHHENYSAPLLIMFSEIFTTSSRLASASLMTTIGICCAAFTSFLDRLLPHLLMQVLTPTTLATGVITAKRTLFPHGYPLPQPPDPSAEEQRAMRERVLAWRPDGALASGIAGVVLGERGAAQRRTAESALGPLGCAECNVHLAVLVLDAVVLAMWPELGLGGAGGEGGAGASPAGGGPGEESGADDGHEEVEVERMRVPGMSREDSVTPPGSFE